MAGVKRRLSDPVYKQMVSDTKTARTGPGGHMGATLQSSAASLIPMASSSDRSQPGPAKHQRRTTALLPLFAPADTILMLTRLGEELRMLARCCRSGPFIGSWAT
jgi:hypothetical protein